MSKRDEAARLNDERLQASVQAATPGAEVWQGRPMTPSLTVVIVTYNSELWLDGLLGSLEPQLRPIDELIVVDNGSRDGTVARFAQTKATVIQQANLGYGAACNSGARRATGEVLLFVNPDVRLAPDALAVLAAAVAPGVAATPQILLMGDPERVNTRGLDLHIGGLAFVRDLRQPREGPAPPRVVPGVSGACFAMRRADFLTVGGFDEAIFLYGEDTEFSWRAAARGLRTQYIPNAVVWHDYAFRLDPVKLQRVEQARRYLVRRHLSRSQRILLAPTLLACRALAWAAAVSFGAAGRAAHRGIRVPPAEPSGLGLPPRGGVAWTMRIPGAGPAARLAVALANVVFWLNALVAWPFLGRRRPGGFA